VVVDAVVTDLGDRYAASTRREVRLDRRVVGGEGSVDGRVVGVVAGVSRVRAARSRELTDDLTRAVDNGGSAASPFGSARRRAAVDALSPRPTGACGRARADGARGVRLGRPGRMADAVQGRAVRVGDGGAVPSEEDRSRRRSLIQLQQGVVPRGSRGLDGRTETLDPTRLSLGGAARAAARKAELEVGLEV